MTDLALPLTQSEAFERTCNTLGVLVKRYDSPYGTCLVQSRKLPVIGLFHLISRGPVIQDEAGRAALLADIRSDLRGPLVVNAPAGDKSPSGIRFAGGAELAMIDLMAPDQMRTRLHQKWRNQLKKGEKSDLTLLDQPLDARRHAWFLEAEQAQQKARQYRGHPAGFLLAYAAANKGQARLYTAMDGPDPVAGMLILKHGQMATYQAGVTTDRGRQCCAHNLLLWTIMTDLQRKNVSQLDLGRADLSDGLRRFKLGAGARVEKLSGTYWLPGWRKRRSQTESRTEQKAASAA